MSTLQKAQGFTLIEVLIGTTILAVMMTLLVSALFTMTRSARAGEQRLDAIDTRELVHEFLRQQLEGAVPLTDRDQDGVEHALFAGTAERLRFVGHLPISHGGGLQFLELRLGRAPSALHLRYRDAWPDTPFSSPDSDWSLRTLLTGVDRLRFSYFGRPTDDETPRWMNEWSNRDRLPDLVRLAYQDADGVTVSFAAAVRVRSAVAQGALFREPLQDGS